MYINKINSTSTFNGKEQYLKEFGKTISDKENAIVRIHLNNSGYPHSMECYILNNNSIVDGAGIGRNPQLKLTEITNFLNNIRKNLNNWDVFEKFAEVMSR